MVNIVAVISIAKDDNKGLEDEDQQQLQYNYQDQIRNTSLHISYLQLNRKNSMHFE